MTIKITPEISRALEKLVAADRKLGNFVLRKPRHELLAVFQTVRVDALINAKAKAVDKLLELLQ